MLGTLCYTKKTNLTSQTSLAWEGENPDIRTSILIRVRSKTRTRSKGSSHIWLYNNGSTCELKNLWKFSITYKSQDQQLTIHTHEAGRVSRICSDFSINFYHALHENSLGFSKCQSIMQPVAKKDTERKTFSQLVWSSRWSRSLQVFFIENSSWVDFIQNCCHFR